MGKEEATQHALGYACGREDASGVPTVHYLAESHYRIGWLEFGYAFGNAWDDYNNSRRCYMTNARDAYDKWQASGGRRIFDVVSLIKHERTI